jgi:hypothetical protein
VVPGLLAALLTSRAHAQSAPPPAFATPTPTDPDPEELYRAGSTQRWVGIPMTIVGGLMVVGGLGLAVKGADCGCAGQTGLETLGGLVELGGVAAFIVGRELWKHGDASIERARALGYQPAALAPVVTPMPGGATVGLRLTLF